MNIANLFFEVAGRYPGLPAVTDGECTRTYDELKSRVGRIASRLRAAGYGSGAGVVLWMENCAEFVECLLACWTAGLRAVPINAKLHPREVAHIVDDSDASIVITTPGLFVDVPAVKEALDSSAHFICTGTGEYLDLLRGDAMSPVETEPTDLAWIFYTSGTTGRPKGAMLTHRNLIFMCMAYLADIDHITPRDTKVHTAAMSHGSGLYGLPFLLQGAHQVVLPGFDIEAIGEAFERYRNVSFFAAPTMLTRLVNSSRVYSFRLKSLRTIYYGGGPMYVADLERALQIFGPRLYQLYGQGESPMTVTGLSQAMHAGAEGPPLLSRLGSCGVPRSGVRVKIVDEDDNELPVGGIGEVVAQSDCVMRGYWNNPDASAAALKGGWLHTGDVGSFDEYGFLTLRDRSKDMIISGGSNIYPREVEEVLLKNPDLIEVSVVGKPHPEWGEEVVAFVVAKPGCTVDAAALDALCLEHIARFKRPKSYRFVDALPKNNYGKVLKTELRRLLNETET